MTAENQKQMTNKEWKPYRHENGSQILDLTVLIPVNGELKPIVSLYGLSPEAVAVGVMAQKTARAIPVAEYINTFREPLELTALNDAAHYH